MKKIINNFDIRQIADSGQCFRWKKIDIEGYEKSYIVPAFDKVLYIYQNGNEIELSCSEEEWNNIWYFYFDCSRDYEALGITILNSNDHHLIEAYNFGKGIRILKQELFETIFSFIISQNNNIKRISKSIELICLKCGKLIDKNNNEYSFPKIEDIPLNIFDDTSLGLGYRADYLKEFCKFVLNNPNWLNSLKDMSYEKAFDNLISIKGIGKKVAECVCLFGLGFVHAFPIDTHIKSILNNYYPKGIDLKAYKNEAGIIQQYLFYFDLKKS